MTRLLAGLLLALFIITGLTVRLESDDYCIAARIDASGVVQPDALAYTEAMYQGWNGRYAQSFFQSVLARFAPFDVMLMPAGFLVGGALLLYTLFHRAGMKAAGLAAVVLTSAWALALPDRDGTLFWHSALITYVAPLVFFGLAWRGVSQGAPALFLLGIGLMAGGFSESMALTMLALWLLLGLHRQAVTFPVGLLVAFFVMSNAPGNAVRSAFFPEPSLMIGLQSAFDGMQRLPGLLWRDALAYALAFTFGVVYPFPDARHYAIRAWWTAAFITFLTLFIVGYAAGWNYRPERIYTLCMALWIAVFYLSGSLTGQIVRTSRGVRVLLTVLLCIVLVNPLVRLKTGMDYARAWDERAAQIQAGLPVHRLPYPWDSLTPPPNYVYHCAESFYHVAKIEVNPVEAKHHDSSD